MQDLALSAGIAGNAGAGRSRASGPGHSLTPASRTGRPSIGGSAGWSEWRGLVRRSLAVTVLAAAFVSRPAAALPGVFVGKGDSKRVSNATQVVLMKKGEHTVVTVWPDYEGPLDKFALVLPVPSDVSLDDVTALKRDAVDHLDEITAPRFHEFWEKDPCEPGDAQQEWERDLRVQSGAGFLGEGMPDMSGGHKLAQELQLDFEPQFKKGEYTFRLIPADRSVETYLEGNGLVVPSSVAEALARYQSGGLSMLVAEVRTSKVELTGARRALLSPIRFATRSEYVLPATLGLANRSGQQELVVYVMHPTQRFEVDNYENAYPPNNASVDLSVKERLGDFYAGVHDALLAKNPKTFLIEYAWPTIKECGEPCPNAPLMIHELLTLGADVFEGDLPKGEKQPALPPMSPDEQQIFDAADKDTRARLTENRAEAARRRGLLDRNRYVVTRLHHRYDDKTLPSDIKLRPAGHVQGGIGTPSGARGELPTAAVESQESRLQVRYNFFHESKKVLHCDAPVRYRWGQAPRSYRGLRKTWTARDLAYKKRNRFDLKDVVKSAIPELGIAGAEPAPTEGVAAAATPEEKSGCAVALPGGAARRSSGSLPGALCLLGLASLTARARRRPGC